MRKKCHSGNVLVKCKQNQAKKSYETVANRPALQEMLKGVLSVKGKW